jgi:hypothetical protein
MSLKCLAEHDRRLQEEYNRASAYVEENCISRPDRWSTLSLDPDRMRDAYKRCDEALTELREFLAGMARTYGRDVYRLMRQEVTSHA